MKRLIPDSLFGQTLVILLAGLIVSHAVGSWIYSADREQAVRAVGGFAVAQRIANLTRLVQDTPPQQRERLVAALSDQSFRVSLTAQRPALPPTDDDGAAVTQAIAEFLVQQLSLGSDRQPVVSASRTDGLPPGRGPMGFGPMAHGPMDHGPAMRGPMLHAFGPFGAFRDLQVAIPLPDRQWLSFATALPAAGPAYSRRFLISMAIMAIIIVAVTIWAARRMTAPLATLASAAERLGKDVNALPLVEAGSVETRRASRAFNDMQTRLRNLIENRTRLLAAISHDLRTPLTLLRLRAENVENAQERERMIATIAEMDAMIGATLQFARDEAVSEPRRATDLAALLQSAVDDIADAGHAVTMEAGAPVIYECQPTALKRAISNLLDNAVKYGKTAKASIRTTPSAIELVIEDEGPGIPEHELARVFQPFYRLESSRSRETGGVGLGLAIALSIVQALGGELKLGNRTGGGLRAAITLPK